jgi:hypothetical protein
VELREGLTEVPADGGLQQREVPQVAVPADEEVSAGGGPAWAMGLVFLESWKPCMATLWH